MVWARPLRITVDVLLVVEKLPPFVQLPDKEIDAFPFTSAPFGLILMSPATLSVLFTVRVAAVVPPIVSVLAKMRR
jgi:putative alpha-1,2-mannosidase